jgi:hypothetical protein
MLPSIISLTVVTYMLFFLKYLVFAFLSPSIGKSHADLKFLNLFYLCVCTHLQQDNKGLGRCCIMLSWQLPRAFFGLCVCVCPLNWNSVTRFLKCQLLIFRFLKLCPKQQKFDLNEILEVLLYFRF